jgi:hypothetical protein
MMNECGMNTVGAALVAALLAADNYRRQLLSERGRPATEAKSLAALVDAMRHLAF